MDASRFDALSRALASGSSRRRMLRVMSGCLAALVGRTVVDETAARKKGKKKKKCRGATKKCGKRCVPKANCCTSADCPPGEVCRSGRCTTCASANDCPTPPPCQEAICQDGHCATVLRLAGFPCEAEPSCVINKTCNEAGQCQGGVPVDVLCPETEICDPQQGCRCPADRVACNGQCGLPGLATCASHGECCSTYCLDHVCIPTCRGKPCTQHEDCCEGVFCAQGFCGRCSGGLATCEDPQDCCYSDCNIVGNVIVCVSFPGGPCLSNIHCGGDSCVGGKCCPPEWDCCIDTDCPPEKVCRDGECESIIGGG
jgi:hypothetical protein